MRYLFACFVFVFLSCSMDSRDSSISNEDKKEDNRGDFDSSSLRELEIERLKGSDQVIDVTLEDRYDGGYSYGSYSGAECQEDDECKDICDAYISSSNRKRCYKSSKALVEDLVEAKYTLLNISEVNSVDISPGLIAGILDIDVDVLEDWVKEQMSEGDLKSFLTWVAVNEDIAGAFTAEDKNHKVIKQAFKVLGELQEDVDEETETGLNLGLIQDEDTFFHLASLENNEVAFQIAYDILDSVCNSKGCKLEVLCARVLKTQNRNKVSSYGYSLECQTADSQARRFRHEVMCYVHGAVSWSFLSDLIEEKEIKEKDFEGESNAITVEVCNDYCGDKNSEKCERVQ